MRISNLLVGQYELAFSKNQYEVLTMFLPFLPTKKMPLVADFGCEYYYYAHVYNCEPYSAKSPMPFVGLYVAAASLVCSLAMAADAFHGFRHKKLWFPCKIFTLNAASLTLLAVAMKMPMDLTTPMPGSIDQLTKLSSTALMSTIMGNFMPSLGPLQNKEIFINIIALGILLVTIVVNVCIELGTGIISSVIRFEQLLVVFFMLVLFVILSVSALTVPTAKKYIELKYGEIHKMASSEQQPEETGRNLTVEKLKRDVKKYWMMAATGSPQFVMARCVFCSASATICLLTTLILVEAALRIFSAYGILSSSSDYKGSTFLIFVIQFIGVGIGTISVAFRWFTTISFKCSNSYKTEFKIENYWTERLVEWKKSPLTLQIRGRKSRKFIQVTKNLILDICIRVQIVTVVVSKSIQLFCILFISRFLSSASKNHTGTESSPDIKLDFSCYVLNLEGEVELPDRILKNICDVADRLIQNGNKKQPKYLQEFLKKSTDFKGVAEFDSDQVPSLDFADLPNCWTLPVVTLTTIAIALPNIEDHVVNRLLRSVSEGLFYINLVEKTLDPKGDLVNIRKAADFVWLGVELYHKWLDEDLQKMPSEGKTSKKTLQRLGDIAKNILMEFKENMNGRLKENPLNWPPEVIAASTMHRVSQTMLLYYEAHNDQTDDKLFNQLSVMIADILGACLTNLPRAITMKCFCSAIEKREESVHQAAQLLGETEEILKILQLREVPTLDPDQATYIDEWRALIKKKNPSAFISSSNNEEASSESNELHISIEEA